MGKDHRKEMLKKRGMTEENYAAMLKQQNGCCAICGRTPERRRLAVDHDHDTDAVRGLLCGRCNVGLGLFDEDVDSLKIAIRYLLNGGY